MGASQKIRVTFVSNARECVVYQVDVFCLTLLFVTKLIPVECQVHVTEGWE